MCECARHNNPGESLERNAEQPSNSVRKQTCLSNMVSYHAFPLLGQKAIRHLSEVAFLSDKASTEVLLMYLGHI